ncbi:MAG: hypothetical protein JWN04_5357 [Myxococcaceae bacterium]|nr:hypothetical protein [Myxococcaceae bacterium]
MSEFVARVTTRLSEWQPTARQLAVTWAVVVVSMAALCLPTLTISPPVWVDEAHIAEYGRLFFHPKTDWSLFWYQDHPTMPWYFVGGALQHLAALATAPSCWGPRVVGLIGGLLSSTALAAWLFRRGTAASAALLLSALFLFDSSFVSAYRGGRVDGLTLTFGFAALYLLASSSRGQARAPILGAGCLLAVAFSIWPSVAFLGPLVAFELYRAADRSALSLVDACLWFLLGAVVTLAILGGVVTLQVPSIWGDATRQLAVAGMTPRAGASSVASNAHTLALTLLVKNPWYVALALLSWRSVSSRWMLALMVLPTALQLVTTTYGNRIIYLLPYLLLAYSEAYKRDGSRTEDRSSRMSWMVLAAAVACAGVIALPVRSVHAWLQRESRDEQRLIEAAPAVAAPGTRLCLYASEFYFVGRTLGWRMFTPNQAGITHCDKFVVQSPIPDSVQAMLDEHGFSPESVVLEGPTLTAPQYGARGYGPYVVLQRAQRLQ